MQKITYTVVQNHRRSKSGMDQHRLSVMARAIPNEIDLSEHIWAHNSGTATQQQPLTSNPEMAEGNFDGNNPSEPVPRLHAKTFLALFAVCLIYFAQLVSVIGAGVVCLFCSDRRLATMYSSNTLLNMQCKPMVTLTSKIASANNWIPLQ